MQSKVGVVLERVYVERDPLLVEPYLPRSPSRDCRATEPSEERASHAGECRAKSRIHDTRLLMLELGGAEQVRETHCGADGRVCSPVGAPLAGRVWRASLHTPPPLGRALSVG